MKHRKSAPGAVFAATVVFLLISILADPAKASDTHEKPVGTDWTWFTDYAYWSSEWTLNVQAGCEVEMAAGVMAFGNPLGGTHRFKSYFQFTTYGAGAVHVRVVSGNVPCRVRLDIGKLTPVPIYGEPSVLSGAVEDAKRALAAEKRRSAN